MPRCPDVYDQWERHDRQQQEWLEARPRCVYCHEAIQDEDLFDVEGNLYHMECAEREFKRKTEDYTE